MKKLLSVLTALTLGTGASISVVACGNSQTNNDVINTDAVKKLVEAGIDGSSLSVKNTQQNALDLMQSTEGIKDVAILSFINQADANKHLIGEDNLFNINITINTTSIATNKALITNVNKVNPDDQTKADAVKKLVEIGIDGSSLNVKNTQQNALDLMQNSDGIKGVATLNFVNTQDANKNLTVDNNYLNIKITVDTASTTTNKALITNINLDDQAKADAVKKIVETGIDANSSWRSYTYQGALNELQNINGIKGVANLSLIDESIKDNLLDFADTNLLNIKIYVGTINITTNKASIKNVNKLDQKEEIIADWIKTSSFDGSSLNTTNTYNDALNLIKSHGLNTWGQCSFNDGNGETKLKKGHNTLTDILIMYTDQSGLRTDVLIKNIKSV